MTVRRLAQLAVAALISITAGCQNDVAETPASTTAVPSTAASVSSVPSDDPTSGLYAGQGGVTTFELRPATTGTFGTPVVTNASADDLELIAIEGSDLTGSIEVIEIAVHRAAGSLVGTSSSWPPYGGGGALQEPGGVAISPGESLQIVVAVRHTTGGGIGGFTITYRSGDQLLQTHVPQALKLTWSNDEPSG